MSKRFYALLLSLFWLPVCAGMPNSIQLGMTAALTGPAAELGKELRTGIEVYFQKVNQHEAMSHQPLALKVYDDGYEPTRAAVNMRKLIGEDKVLATIGNVGTPTAVVTVPIAIQNKTLMFAAFSGGKVLRPEPPSRYIINYRPGYADETRQIIHQVLANGIAPEKIAFFTQQDVFGDTVYQSAVKLLQQRGITQPQKLVHGRYRRNTENVEEAVARILQARITPEVVIMASSYKPAAKFITLLQRYLPDIWFINISFVGSGLLARELGENAHHVVITQVVPLLDSALPVVREYKAALKQYAPDRMPNDVSLEGYIIARLFCQGLQHVQGVINRESVIDALEQIHDLDIGIGALISFGKKDHQGSQKIWPAHIEKGRIASFDWSTLKRRQ